jgi:uncharacterized protein YjbI with pentapeptide repeats
LSATKPIISDHPLYLLLREGEITDFNRRRAAGESVDLRGCNFRGVDLRGLNAEGLDLRDAYLRGADLRGLDLRDTHLQGASLAHAHLSGAYFSADIPANELMMSVEHGTRLRY